MAQRVVIITGCSTGIGLSTAALLAKNVDKKYKVYACMRNLAKKGTLLLKAADCVDKTLFFLEMDVLFECSVNTAIKHVLDTDGRVDVLINNAGLGLRGAMEYQQWETITTLYETNVYGVIRVIRAVLPSMKKQNSGQIITIGSILGLSASPFNAVYSSTKFAVTGLCEALAPELAQFNIKISLIEPGPVATAFNSSSESKGISGLENGDVKTKQMLEKFEAKVKVLLSQGGVLETPDNVAECILKVVEDEKPHVHNITNPFYQEVFKKKYFDITGDAEVQGNIQMFFSS